MSAFANIVAGGVFHAAVLFLVAAGLQLVFGVQKIVNLACGSFYALGAYFGITFIGFAHQFGMSDWLLLPGLVVSGIRLGFIGPPIERLLRTVYDRDESFQLLLTFALVLMFQDVFKFVWGANPRSLDSGYLIYGTISGGDFSIPVYNLLVIAAAIGVAAGLGGFLNEPITAGSCARPPRTAPWRKRWASTSSASIRSSSRSAPCSAPPRARWSFRPPPLPSTWRSNSWLRPSPSSSSAGSAQYAAPSPAR